MFSFLQKNFLGHIIKSAFSTLLIFSVLTSVFILPPKKAEAQLYVLTDFQPASLSYLSDIFQHIKEDALDGIAWSLAKQIIQQISADMVSWINSGFNGNPAFIQDPLGALGEVADQVLGEFIDGNGLGFLCSPFQVEIKAALVRNYYGGRGGVPRPPSCTLGEIADNFEAFVSSPISFEFDPNASPGSIPSASGAVNSGQATGFIAGGGWSAWLATVENNPYEAYLYAEEEFQLAVASQQGALLAGLDWGDGFLSWKECSGSDPGPLSGSGSTGPGGQATNCQIVTPGSVIEDTLVDQLGSGVRSLEIADEINEILAALMNQLLSQVFGAVGGLAGASSPSQDFDGQSYVDALRGSSPSGSGSITLSRDLSDAGIDRNVALLNKYLTIKNDSLEAVSDSIDLQEDIIACYKNKPNAPGAEREIDNASSTIETSLSPLIDPLEADILKAETDKIALEGYRTELHALPANNLEAYSALKTRYLQFLLSFETSYIIQIAELERDHTLPQRLDPVDKVGRKELKDCRAYNNPNNNNNNTGTNNDDRGGGQ